MKAQEPRLCKELKEMDERWKDLRTWVKREMHSMSENTTISKSAKKVFYFMLCNVLRAMKELEKR